MATDAIERYYEEYSIYKSLIICEDEDSAMELIRALREKDHSVCAILDDDITDERPKYLSTLREFEKSMYRVMIMTYYAWVNTSSYAQAYVLPFQNLIVFYDLDHNLSRTIANWLDDSEMYGFVENVNILSV
jgi:superfamily II DNA/RNA helicase